MIYDDYMILYGWLDMETLGLGWRINKKIKERLK